MELRKKVLASAGRGRSARSTKDEGRGKVTRRERKEGRKEGREGGREREGDGERERERERE